MLDRLGREGGRLTNDLQAMRSAVVPELHRERLLQASRSGSAVTMGS